MTDCFSTAAFKPVYFITSQCFMLGAAALCSFSPQFKTVCFHLLSHQLNYILLFKPNCISMASKLVLSSHAISIMRSVSATLKLFTIVIFCCLFIFITPAFITAIFHLIPNTFPFLSPAKWFVTYHTYFNRQVFFF